MNVLSLFDGISCGQIALERASISIDKYFSSEIDKNAIIVTQDNYPKTIQLGSVLNIKPEELPKIDLLIGGSPCQGFSFAGKGLNFSDERSKLFFEFSRILKQVEPKYFLLENVRMNKESENFISNILNVEPVIIESCFFSAQSRKRLYWTNLSIQPYSDKKIFIQDIVDEEILSKEEIKKINFLKELNFGNFKTENSKKRIIKNIKGSDQKLNCLTASNTNNPAGCGCSNFITKNSQGNFSWRKINRTECEKAQTIPVGYTKSIPDGCAKKALGNGWTVDVISHIFKGLK